MFFHSPTVFFFRSNARQQDFLMASISAEMAATASRKSFCLISWYSSSLIYCREPTLFREMVGLLHSCRFHGQGETTKNDKTPSLPRVVKLLQGLTRLDSPTSRLILPSTIPRLPLQNPLARRKETDWTVPPRPTPSPPYLYGGLRQVPGRRASGAGQGLVRNGCPRQSSRSGRNAADTWAHRYGTRRKPGA